LGGSGLPDKGAGDRGVPGLRQPDGDATAGLEPPGGPPRRLPAPRPPAAIGRADFHPDVVVRDRHGGGTPLVLDTALVLALRIVEAGFGKRVLFGSDQMVWPETIELAIESIESADFLTPEQKRDIFFNNAVRFLRLTEAQVTAMHGRRGR
jgi:hypothetical protein